MKYYTKEWYELLQARGLAGEFKKFNLRTCKNNFPEWLLKRVDLRLLAPGYLPETCVLENICRRDFIPPTVPSYTLKYIILERGMNFI